jgi:hypothetical protein
MTDDTTIHLSHARTVSIRYTTGKVNSRKFCVRFQVLTAASMKMKAFWDVAVCSVGVHRRTASVIRVMIIISVMMEAVRISETSVYSNETTWRYMPEGSHRENPSFHCFYGLGRDRHYSISTEEHTGPANEH